MTDQHTDGEVGQDSSEDYTGFKKLKNNSLRWLACRNTRILIGNTSAMGGECAWIIKSRIISSLLFNPVWCTRNNNPANFENSMALSALPSIPDYQYNTDEQRITVSSLFKFLKNFKLMHEKGHKEVKRRMVTGYSVAKNTWKMYNIFRLISPIILRNNSLSPTAERNKHQINWIINLKKLMPQQIVNSHQEVIYERSKRKMMAQLFREKSVRCWSYTFPKFC